MCVILMLVFALIKKEKEAELLLNNAAKEAERILEDNNIKKIKEIAKP